MTDKIMDGKKVSGDILAEAEQRVAAIKAKTGKTPCLATVLVGDDPASVTYTKMKRNRCEKVGMRSLKVELPAETTTAQLIEAIRRLGDDDAVNGILLQHPSPPHVDERAAFEAIPPGKDVDGVTLHSFACMWHKLPGGFDCCTPGGMIQLLDAYKVKIEGRRAVVIGRSPIVGMPMAGLLLARNATVTICHSRTQDLPGIVKQADIVCAAVGRANFVQGDWIREGAVVLDAGYNEGNVGDVDYAAAYDRASLITPVPGGVGPMTIAVLIEQTVTAAERQWS